MGDINENDVAVEDTQSPASSKDNSGSSLADLQKQLNDAKAEVSQWKSKYAGLQGQFTKVKGNLDEANSTLASVTGSYEEQIAELNNKLKTVEGDLKTKSDAYSQAQSQLNVFQVEKEVLGKIKNFAKKNESPGLVSMFEEGLMQGIENMDDESFEAYLAKMNTHLGNIQKSGAEIVHEGSIPTPSAESTATKTLDTLNSEMNDVLRTHGPYSPEYQKAYDAYDNALVQSLNQ